MRKMRWFVAGLALALLVSCAEKPKDAAVVNGEAITKEALEGHLKNRLRMHNEDGASVDAAAMRDAVLSQLIDEKLMLQAAKKEGISADEEEVSREFDRAKAAYPDEVSFTAGLEEQNLTPESLKQKLRENDILTKFVDTMVEGKTISDDSLKEHFKNLKSPPTMPERVKMRFIQISDKEKAEQVAGRIKAAGTKGFDNIADELTGTPGVVVSAVNWVQPGTFSMKMAEVIKGLKKGEWTGPVETKVAMYLLKVYDREEPRPKTFEEAKDELKALMARQQREDAVKAWLADARKKATIVMNSGK